MNKNTKIKVRNRSNASVGYTIPDLSNLRRTYAANEVKEVTFEELQKLSYRPGGGYLLQHYLVIENIEAREEILGAVELEYAYTEKDIEKLLMYGSMDELLDCLDFAPAGVIDLVKKIAVDTELNDVKKRNAIFNKTGFNVNNAIMINAEMKEEEETVETPSRRVAAPASAETVTTTPERRQVIKK